MNIVLSYRSGKSRELGEPVRQRHRNMNYDLGSIQRASNILEGVAATVAEGRSVNPVWSAIGDSLNKKCNAP